MAVCSRSETAAGRGGGGGSEFVSARWAAQLFVAQLVLSATRLGLSAVNKSHVHAGIRVSSARAALLRTLAFGALSAAASAAAADGGPTPDGSFTMYGVTVYGTVDLAAQYQSHGTPESDYHPAVTEALINKNSNGSVATITGNQISASRIGLKGLEDFGNGWSGVFKVETLFDPQSGNISDALRSMTLQNGVPLASQTTGADSALAGQLFNGAAYVGLAHSQLGSLTFGRQTTFVADGISGYDPMGSAQGFSLVGWSGTYAGAGATENRRLDGSARYEVTAGAVHAGAMYQPKTGSNPGTATQLLLGFRFPGGSVDAFYSRKNDAMMSAPLSAVQVTSVAQVCGGATVAGFACASIDKALAGTIADLRTWAVMAKYKVTPSATAFAAYEHIQYQNPSTIVPAGQKNIGGYILVTVNNAAYPSARTLGLFWAGMKYAVKPNLEFTWAYYHYDQNSYATGPNAGCSSALVSNQCSGKLDAASVLLDYRFTKRFDVYGGAMWSQIQGGPANGFLNTSTIDPTIGIRYSF